MNLWPMPWITRSPAKTTVPIVTEITSRLQKAPKNWALVIDENYFSPMIFVKAAVYIAAAFFMENRGKFSVWVIFISLLITLL
jgi:hypothetical protein